MIDGDVYYLGTAEHGVAALDLHSFEVQRTFGCGPAMIWSIAYTQGDISTADGDVLIEGNRLIFSASDGYLYVYDKTTGDLLDRRCMGAPSFVASVRMGNGIVTADFAGNVMKFQIDWKLPNLT